MLLLEKYITSTCVCGVRVRLVYLHNFKKNYFFMMRVVLSEPRHIGYLTVLDF